MLSRFYSLIVALSLAALCALPAGAQVTPQTNPAQTYTTGTGALYLTAYPDQETPATFAAITTVNSTTLVIQGVAGQAIYAWYIGALTKGTNSGQVVWLYGPNSSTLTYMFGGPGFGLPTSSGIYLGSWTGANGTLGAPIPAPIPYIIPAGQNLYVYTQGSTFNFIPYVRYAQH